MGGGGRGGIGQGLFGALFRRGPDPPPTEEVGTTAAFTTSGYLVSTERNVNLRGRERYVTFSNLLANVAIVAAGTRAYLNLASGAEWNIEPADESRAAQEVADLVENAIHDMARPWKRVVRRAAAYRFYGFVVLEWVAENKPDGTIGFFDVASRPQSTIERWDLDANGRVRGCTQRIPSSSVEVFLPRSKIVHIVDDSLSDSPEGVGLFRHLVDANQRLQRYQLLEAFGFESDLRGIPVGRAPYGKLRDLVQSQKLSAQQASAITQPLEDFIRKHIKSPELGFVLDSTPYRDLGDKQAPSATMEWGLEIMQGSPQGQEEVGSAIERLTREMSVVLGVQWLLLGGDGSGSMALGRTFTEQFALMVNAGLGELSEAFEHDLVPPLLALNGIDEELAPTLRAEEVQYRTVDQVTAALKDLADAGAPLLSSDPAVNTVRDMLGVPRLDPDMIAADASLLGEPEPVPDPTVPDPTEIDE